MVKIGGGIIPTKDQHVEQIDPVMAEHVDCHLILLEVDMLKLIPLIDKYLFV